MPDKQPENLSPEEARRRLNSTMQNAKAAMRSMQVADNLESPRSSVKDKISELMLPLSLFLLSATILLPESPQIRACAFLAPLAALYYYLYRRIGVISTFSTRQAYVAWRLLIATFLFGASFALFALFTFTYITQILLKSGR